MKNDKSFDGVFNALIKKFGAPEIDRQIYGALKTPPDPTPDCHRMLLDLSRRASGQPQIVTTKDLLLMRCMA